MRNRGDVAGDVPGDPARRAASHIPRSEGLPMTLPLPSPRPDSSEPELRAEARVQRVEAELLATSQELSGLHRELETLRERVRLDDAQRAELLDVVSHELRTPLTVIGGYHRLLLGEQVGPLNDQQRKFLEESHRS